MRHTQPRAKVRALSQILCSSHISFRLGDWRKKRSSDCPWTSSLDSSPSIIKRDQTDSQRENEKRAAKKSMNKARLKGERMKEKEIDSHLKEQRSFYPLLLHNRSVVVEFLGFLFSQILWASFIDLFWCQEETEGLLSSPIKKARSGSFSSMKESD